MEIWFYHLTAQKLESALPALLEKCVQRGWKSIVQTSSAHRVQELDAMLWDCSAESFLAHGTEADGDFELQQIYLTEGAEKPLDAQVRFFVDGADFLPVMAQPNAYERMIVMFDGSDESALQAARNQWRAAKAAGGALSYWKQGEGGWEKAGV